MMHWFARFVCARLSVWRARGEAARVRHKNLFRLSFPLSLSPPHPFPLRSPLRRIPTLERFDFYLDGVFLSAVKLRHVEIMIIARWAKKSGIGMQTFNSSVRFVWKEKDISFFSSYHLFLSFCNLKYRRKRNMFLKSRKNRIYNRVRFLSIYLGFGKRVWLRNYAF